MTWSGNDDLAKVVAWIDDVLNVLDATPKPIVWDGSNEAFGAIVTAIPEPWWCVKEFCSDHLRIWCDASPMVTDVALGWSIQVIGGSFAILPPEVTT